MIRKIKTAFAIFCLLYLTACPAPEFNHIIINQSDAVLDIEYEYVMQPIKHDSSQMANPAKMTLEQYEKDGDWGAFSPENEYRLDAGREEKFTDINGNQAEREIKKVTLKLLPKEVLRVFVSAHINLDPKGLRKINLRGKNGEASIEGDGFEQFAPYRPSGFLPSTKDYRMVYR